MINLLAIQLEQLETSKDYERPKVHYKLGSQTSEPHLTMLEDHMKGLFRIRNEEEHGTGLIHERIKVIPTPESSLTEVSGIFDLDISTILSGTQIEWGRLIEELVSENQDLYPYSYIKKIEEAQDMRRVLSDFQLFVSSPRIQEMFAGKYTAIYNGKVIGSGTSAKEAYDNAKKTDPRAKPAIAFVPGEDVCIFDGT